MSKYTDYTHYTKPFYLNQEDSDKSRTQVTPLLPESDVEMEVPLEEIDISSYMKEAQPYIEDAVRGRYVFLHVFSSLQYVQ